MCGYSKAIRLCLLEYLALLFMHTLYAFIKDTDTGMFILGFSASILAVTAFFALIVKKEKVVIAFITVSSIIATTVIGYKLDTLALAIVIYVVMSTTTALLVNTSYIAYVSATTTLALIAYAVFVPDSILKGIASIWLYALYIVAYLIFEVNLFVIIYYVRKYMQDIELKTAEAESAKESKDVFLANMSHDVRTPMNAICGMAELTLREKDLPETARENIESISNSGKVLISIVNDILDYTKLENGNVEIIPVVYSLRNLVKGIEDMVPIRMDDKRLTLETHIQEDLPDVYIGDEVRLRQILFNLLSNAIKYTENGFIILDIKGVNEGGFVDFTITVTDNGIGIKKEDIPKVFNSFQHIDSRRNSETAGTGLGLCIAKKLLDLMGGTITVESTYGVGSKFTVRISQKISNELRKEPMDEEEIKSEPKVSAPEGRVLVIDDNKVNLKVAQGLLKTFNLTVDIASSGRDGLEILEDHKDYDIIFIDHMMPELDGVDTLKLIRAEDSEYMKKVPIIALTANVGTGVREMFISSGFNDYVPKPIDMKWLNGILRKYLPEDKIK